MIHFNIQRPVLQVKFSWFIDITWVSRWVSRHTAPGIRVVWVAVRSKIGLNVYTPSLMRIIGLSRQFDTFWMEWRVGCVRRTLFFEFQAGTFFLCKNVTKSGWKNFQLFWRSFDPLPDHPKIHYILKIEKKNSFSKYLAWYIHCKGSMSSHVRDS